MELVGTMPQSIYKKSLFIACYGFVLKSTISATLFSPQYEPVLPGEGLAIPSTSAYAVPKAMLPRAATAAGGMVSQF